MKKIAITGGIGSGKSTVLQMLKTLGYPVMSSDTIVSDLYKKRRIRKMLKELFPDAVTGFMLKIDRQKIAKEIFSDPVKHKLLTDLITPLVIEEVFKRADKLKTTCFIEVPLLFECEYAEYFDDVWVVARDKSERIKSVMTRSNLTSEQVEARMNNQVNYDTLDLSNYTVIKNQGDLQALENLIKSLLEKV